VSGHFVCDPNNPKVRTVPVKVTPITLDKLNVRPPKLEEINSVEASLRVDAVASAGKGYWETHCVLNHIDEVFMIDMYT
jgi:hypothetical protein